MPDPHAVELVELADALGVHTQTVQRALGGKTVRFEGVVHPLGALLPVRGLRS